MARQPVIVHTPAAQIIVPVQFSGQADDPGAIATMQGPVHSVDDFGYRHGVIHFRRGSVQERSHGGPKQDSRASANIAAAPEFQSAGKADAAKAPAAVPEAEYAVNGLTPGVARRLPVDSAILPESRCATSLRPALHQGGA